MEEHLKRLEEDVMRQKALEEENERSMSRASAFSAQAAERDLKTQITPVHGRRKLMNADLKFTDKSEGSDVGYG